VLLNVFSNSSLSDSKIFNSSLQWHSQEFTIGGGVMARVWGRAQSGSEALSCQMLGVKPSV